MAIKKPTVSWLYFITKRYDELLSSQPVPFQELVPSRIPQAEVTMFRIVQEALNNIKRHSKASEAVVTLGFNAEHLKMTIEDDGQGFPLPKEINSFASRGKLGLIGMQERIKFINGTFQVRSNPGAGTSLLIEAKC
jgi:signal transduction histidine kinase